MQVLCLESMETLRKEVSNNPDLVNEEWDYLESTFDLHCVNFNIDVGKIRDLKTDTKEAKNCVAIYEDLENLTPAHATDERLWTTLCFRECAQYARARWPIGKINKGTNKENFALGHWFTSTNRDRYRNNAISRLWWMAHMTKKVAEETKMEHDKVIDILLSDSDFRAATIERTTSSSATKVVAAIIKINQERESKGVKYKREKNREFMTYVNFVGRRTQLTGLSTGQIEDVFRPKLEEIYNYNKKRKIFGLFGRG